MEEMKNEEIKNEEVVEEVVVEDNAPNLEITDDDKLFALLAYIFSPIVPIVLLFIEEKKNRPFIKYHTVQSLIYGVILFVLTFILSFVFIGVCVGLVGLGVQIYLGIKAYQGEMFELPVITNFAKQQGWM
jgi:uncharacterized membrane protein